MHCGSCGNVLDEGQLFCDKCGRGSGDEGKKVQIVRSEKNEGFAAVLSILFGGLGQIYVGRIKRGLGILFLYAVLFAIGSLAITIGRNLYQMSYYGFYYEYNTSMLLVSLTFLIISIGILVWSVFDAYKLAKEYNVRLRNTGEPPW
ncbi:MAG: zinc ribbon domain-containing protein [Methanomassiliicoccaceae archaeon]|jgi:TM2 domain-containing membrane protein YozV|nr:zinc ribbon domain-containing protein [Methanomassiliicoccaceae archaeon]